MPVRWDATAQSTLLMMIVSQHPAILSKVDTEAIAQAWESSRGEKATPRAIQEQVTGIRKKLKNSDFQLSATPSSARSTFSQMRTPKTPVTPTKRSRPVTKTAGGSAKKQRTKKDLDSEDESSPVLTDELEAMDDADQDSDVGGNPPLIGVSNTTERRTLPSRAKSRSQSYIISDDSDTIDDGAKQADSDIDSEYGPKKRAKGHAALVELLQRKRTQLKGTGGILAEVGVVAFDGQGVDEAGDASDGETYFHDAHE